jgi:hypothetical protein
MAQLYRIIWSAMSTVALLPYIPESELCVSFHEIKTKLSEE